MSMFYRFHLKGTVAAAIRSEEDMKNMDKTIADNAFKIQKKRFDEFMLSNGFVKYKGTAYVRCNDIDVLEYVGLQKECYGSKTVTVNYALIPLYVPHDYLSFDLGDRLGVLLIGRDVWWDYSNEKIAEISFSNIMDAVFEYLFPWFRKNSHKDILMKSILEEKKKRESYGGRLSDIQQLWLDTLMKPVYNAGVMEDNMRVFKLPSRFVLMKGKLPSL